MSVARSDLNILDFAAHSSPKDRFVELGVVIYLLTKL